MAKDHLSGKLAVILHADVAGSVALVQQDKELAHERIQDAFRRFSDTKQCLCKNCSVLCTTEMGLKVI